MIAIFLLPVYIIFNYYIIRRSLKWLKSCHEFFGKKGFIYTYIVVYILLAVSPLIGFFWPTDSVLKRGIMHVANYWFAVCIYMLLFVVVADILVKILWKCKVISHDLYHSKKAFSITGGVVLVATAAMCIYGVINARVVQVNNYEVDVEKTCEAGDELNIVLLADLHIGYNVGCAQMERMVEKVNAQDADIIVIAGDMFDNSYESLDDPERLKEILMSMKSKYGVYCVYGNHDIEEPIIGGFTFGGKKNKLNDERMTAFIESMDFKLLRDESTLVDDSFYIVGRRDKERPGNPKEERLDIAELTKDLDQSKPIIVLDHEPRELQETADAGADLDLCGHTHDGQIFPGNLFIKLFWENACGYLKKDEMHNIVTSGVGLYGPDVRTFTDAEICNVKVNFAD